MVMKEDNKTSFLWKLRSPLSITWYICGILTFISLLPVTRVNGDDFVYGQQITQMGTFPWIAKQLSQWSGRIFSETMTGVVLPLDQMIWRILNTLFICLLVYSLVKLAFCKIDVISTIVGFSVLGLMTPAALVMTVYWTVGSFYYVWPLALGLFSSIFLMNSVRGIQTRFPLLYVIAAFCAATGVEQISPCIVVFGALTIASLIRKKQRVSGWVISYFFVSLAALSIEALSPGSALRTGHEAAHWYPEFSSLSVFQKLKRGITWQFNDFAYYVIPSATVLALCVMIGILIRRFAADPEVQLLNEPKGGWYRISAIGATGVLIVLLNGQHFGMGDDLVSFQTIGRALFDTPTDGRTVLGVVPYLLWSAFWLLLGAACVGFVKEKGVTFFLVLAVAATGAVMYISPTIYASGARTMFVPSVLLLLVLLKVLNEYKHEIKSIALLICIPAGINLLHFFITISSGYSNTLF